MAKFQKDILQEQEELLRQGFYLLARVGRYIFCFTSAKKWERYASFQTEEEAKRGMREILEKHNVCLECELNPWCVKFRPGQEIRKAG